MVKKAIFISIMFCLLTACGSTKTETIYVDRPVITEVPVYVQPEIEPIIKPKMPVISITEKSTHAEVAQAYYDSLLLYKEYCNMMEKAINKFFKRK